MGYTTLKALVDANIKTNGRQAITGAKLNDVLTQILQGVDILDRANPADTSGLSKIVLDKSKTFAEQVTGQDTIYEIRDAFQVNANHTIPNGCVLYFNGGNLSGTGVVTFSKTRIIGDAKISCDCAGTIDGLLDLNWFGLKSGDSSFDNGAIINKYGDLSNQVVISIPGNYYFSTPIVLTGHVFVDFNVALYYNGSNGNLSAVKFEHGSVPFVSPDIHVRRIECVRNSVNPDYSHDASYFMQEDENTTILRGVEFSSINNAKIKVDNIVGFNENVRISDTNAAGNSYNEYRIGYSLNSNVHIRVYQDNGGWCYANKLYAQRLTNSWSSFSDGQSNHYYSCGGMFAGPGTQTDTNNDCSNWLIQKVSTEGFDDYCFLLKNCGNFVFVGGRVETSGKTPYLAKAVGSVYSFSIRDYILPGEGIDLSEAVAFSYKANPSDRFLVCHLDAGTLKAHCHATRSNKFNFMIDNGINIGAANYQYRDVCKAINLDADTDGSVKIYDSGSVGFGTNDYIGVILDTTNAKKFLLKARRITRYLQIVYLKDSSGNRIESTQVAQESFGAPLSQEAANRYVWDSNTMSFTGSIGTTQNYNFSFTIPAGVNSVLLRIRTADFDLFSFGAYASVYAPPMKAIGTTAERPYFNDVPVDYTLMERTKIGVAWIGFQYFDTTLQKFIVQTQSGWTNMDGSALT